MRLYVSLQIITETELNDSVIPAECKQIVTTVNVHKWVGKLFSLLNVSQSWRHRGQPWRTMLNWLMSPVVLKC